MTTGKVINFGPGPAKIPIEVLEKAQKEFCNYANSGMSVMELSHRGSEFASLLNTTENTLRELLDIPNNYKVLFLHGGGVGQFAAVAYNLVGLKSTKCADYIVIGHWSSLAADEAKKYGQVNLVISKSQNTTIEDQSTWQLNANSSYVYYCSNETVNGVEFPFVPETNGVPLVCDMSSNFLSRPIDVRKFGLIFAGAQKNLGCAGMALVIIREDLLGFALPQTPLIWDYAKQALNQSCINTPPMYSIYVMKLVLEWVKDHGGAEGMRMLTETKAQMIYQLIDKSNSFYVSPVDPRFRSCMNIPLRVGSEAGEKELEELFLKEVTKKGMLQLRGHRSVGGIRISLYNAITIEEVQKLVEFMEDFQLRVITRVTNNS